MTNGICMHCGKEVKLSKKGKVARHKAKTAMAGGTYYEACQGSGLQALTKENLEAHLGWLKNIAETNINGQFAADAHAYLTERHSDLLQPETPEWETPAAEALYASWLADRHSDLLQPEAPVEETPAEETPAEETPADKPWVAGGLNYIELSNEADRVQAELDKLGVPEALRTKIDCLLRRGVEDACKVTRAKQRVEEMQQAVQLLARTLK